MVDSERKYETSQQRRVAVAVMAKVPGATAVKSRLHPALGAATATRLYECFLRDRLDALATVARVDPMIAFTPVDGAAAMAALAPAGFTLVAQRGDDLSERLLNLFTELLAGGRAGAIAMDSDSPTLPMAFVEEAARILERGEADVVLGPSDDGGYYLIGTRACHRVLFDAMPWSTNRVLGLTLERARLADLRVHLLPAWFDVDTPEDLARLRQALAREAGGPARTRALLVRLEANGVVGAADSAAPAAG